MSGALSRNHAPSSAVSQTPGDAGEGIMTFFNPVIICDVTTPGQKVDLNEALLFYEALHGNYGYQDTDIERFFGENSPATATYYLENNVVGGYLTYLYDEPTDPEPMQCLN